MTKKEKIKSNIIGLDIGLAFGRFFLDSEDLHFGYWPNGEKPTARNFAWAQENHSKLIMDKIPEGAKRILDVGSGSGNLALKLLGAKYEVDCVIPSEYLAQAVKEKLNRQGETHICKFEDFNCHEQYDVIIFSESFQYVNINLSLEKVEKLLNPGGHLLICDFFHRDVPGKSPMGGGHKWKGFQEVMANYPLNLVTDIDITNEAAPTIDLLAKFNADVASPIAEISGEYLIDHYPKITKLFKWKFKKRLKKIHNVYLSGSVNGESFKQFKEYHLLVYKKK